MTSTTDNHLSVDVRRLLPPQAQMASPHARLGDLGLDSMDIVDFLCALDEDFQIRLTTDELTNETTIDELIALVNLKTQTALKL